MNLDFASLPRLGLFLLQANLVWCVGFLIAHALLRGVNASVRYRTRLALLGVLPLSILVALGLNHPIAHEITEPVTVNLYNDTVLVDALESPLSDQAPSTTALIRGTIWGGSLVVLIGVLLLGLGYARGLRRLFKVAGRSHPEVQEQLNRVARDVDYPKPIRLILSRFNVSPFSFGLRRPNIVIPAQLLKTLNEEELDLVLRHEVQHIHRHDFTTNLFQKLVKIVFFYNPCVHWLDHQIDLDREFLCDQAVLESAHCTKRQYAELLIRVAEFVSRNPMLSPQVPFHSKQSHLRKRLKHMKTYTLTSRTPWRVGFSVATVAALFVAVSLTGYGADSNTQTRKKSSNESLTLELGPEQLTVRRNGQEQAFDKESKEYKELIRAYQRLVERVDQKSDYPLNYPEKQARSNAKQRQETEVQIAKDRAAKVAAQLADLQAEREALEAARRAEKRQHALQLKVAEEALAKAKQEQEMVLHGYARAGKETQNPFDDQAQDLPAKNYAQISPEGRYKTERMTGTYNSGQMTGSHDKGEMTGRYAYAQSKSRYAQSYHPDAPESSPYRSNQINDQRRGLEILQKELAANQRELERQQKELQRSIQRQQDDLKRQQVALEQQWKKAEIEQERAIKEQRRLRAEYADLAKAYEARAREQDKLAKEHEAQAKRQQALLIRIRQELAEIGAIDKSWRNLDIDLNGQRLEINGKRQPEDVYLRTKEIYQEATGEELRGTLRLKTNK